jgi:hypothetical protein
MTMWQPIKTAPADGSLFLAYNTAHGDMAVVGLTNTPDEDEPWCWTDVGGANRGIAATYNGHYFQFWMPLPPPPGARADVEREHAPECLSRDAYVPDQGKCTCGARRADGEIAVPTEVKR